MARPKKTPENTGLMSWTEVGKRVGLTAKQARAEGQRALAKLREAFRDEGIDEEFLKNLAHDKEREEALRGEALSAMVAIRESDDA